VLQHILVYFREKSFKKAIKALVQQKDYEQRLTDAIEMLGDRSSQFDRVARTCGLEEIHFTRTEVQAVRVDVQRFNTEVHQHMNLAREESYAQNQNLEYRLKHHMGQLLQSLVNSIASDSKLDPKTQNLRLPILPLKKSRSAPELRRRRNVTEQVLLNLLEYDAVVSESDVQKSLRYVYRLPKPAQDRIIAMIRHHKFQSWLAGVESSALFLNGHYSTTGSIRQCPTSFVCARLASAMQSDRDAEEEPSLHPPVRTIAISFFCAEHVETGDPYRGARSIMKSLIAQLLASYRFDIRVMAALQEADFDHVKTLCAGFKLLVDSLPAEIVLVCIVDAITVHEESESRSRKVEFVLEALAGLASSEEGRECVFKLLLTCPRVSRRYSGRLGSACVLTMPEKVVSQGAFTMAKWDGYTNIGTQ